MRASSLITAFAAAQAVAVPLEKRATALSANDIAVVQLAHFLENLEYNLYTGGFNNFTSAQYDAAGFPENFRRSVQLISTHESVHRDFLASVLTSAGQTPAPPCTYVFPYSDPTSFVSLANMITSTGIGAYIGGADLVMDNPTVLTAATSILLVEARHDAILRRGLGADPAPNAFDTPVTALWAYSIAKNFAVSCPVDLYPTALPKLTIAPTPPANLRPQTPAGTALTLTWDSTTFLSATSAETPVYAFFVNQVSDPVFVPAGTAGANSASVALPAGLAGAAFVGLSSFSGGLNATQLSSFGTLAGPMIVELS